MGDASGQLYRRDRRLWLPRHRYAYVHRRDMGKPNPLGVKPPWLEH